MGKLKRFDIVFGNSQSVFFAGQPVCGSVHLELVEPMKMRELRMTCFGRAYVHWSEVENVGHRGGRQRIETVEYNADENYFEYRFKLWPSGSANEDVMPPGTYEFPFAFDLPLDLPPSFEGDYGYIRYWAKATIDRPWMFDQHTKQAFTVITNLDLNKEPGAAESLHYHGEIAAGCCCVPSGRFSGRFCTNYRGFVPGTELIIYSEIENDTNSSCWAEVKLKLNITYVAGRKYKQEKKVIKRAQVDEVERGKNFTWTESLEIPPLPPSKLRGCKLITTQYLLQFLVGSRADCSCDDVEFEDEVIIGTIPLAPALPPSLDLTTCPDYPIAVGKRKKRAPKEGDKSILDVLEGRRTVDTPVTGPPSYEESMFGEVSIRDKDDSDTTEGTLTFTPRYSFYKRSRNKVGDSETG